MTILGVGRGLGKKEAEEERPASRISKEVGEPGETETQFASLHNTLQ